MLTKEKALGCKPEPSKKSKRGNRDRQKTFNQNQNKSQSLFAVYALLILVEVFFWMNWELLHSCEGRLSDTLEVEHGR